MAKPKATPTQIEPLIDPETQSAGAPEWKYFLLEEMHSPPVSTPNAVRWEEYEKPEYLNPDALDEDRRVALGYIVYGRRLAWEQLALYNLMPADRIEALLFDLWREFGRDTTALVDFFNLVAESVSDDPLLYRLRLAIRLLRRREDLVRAKETMEKIKDLVAGEEG